MCGKKKKAVTIQMLSNRKDNKNKLKDCRFWRKSMHKLYVKVTASRSKGRIKDVGPEGSKPPTMQYSRGRHRKRGLDSQEAPLDNPEEKCNRLATLLIRSKKGFLPLFDPKYHRRWDSNSGEATEVARCDAAGSHLQGPISNPSLEPVAKVTSLPTEEGTRIRRGCERKVSRKKRGKRSQSSRLKKHGHRTRANPRGLSIGKGGSLRPSKSKYPKKLLGKQIGRSFDRSNPM